MVVGMREESKQMGSGSPSRRASREAFRASCVPCVACVTALCLLTGSTRAQMPPTKVVTAQAQERQARATVSLVGTLLPARRSQVGSEVAGLVIDMPAREGDVVQKGQLLCRLNPDVVELRLREARARLKALQAVHEELLAGTREEDKRRMKALADEAEARVIRWRFETERMEKLYTGKEAGSVREVYDSKAEYDMAVQRQLAAQAEYEMALKGPRAETIARAAQDAAEQQAVVDRIQRELDKTTIEAPYAGTVVARHVEVGEWINEGGQVVELVDLSTVRVRVEAPESALPFVKPGDPGRAHVEGLGRSFDGVVRHVIPQVNPQARTFPVEIEIPNGEGVLAAGMFARATVSAGPPAKFVCVPKDAVLMRDGVNYVTLVAPGGEGALMGVPVAVTTGASVEDWIALTSDNVPDGSHVVIRGNERVFMPMPVVAVDSTGTPVDLKLTPPAAAAPGSGGGTAPTAATGTSESRASEAPRTAGEPHDVSAGDASKRGSGGGPRAGWEGR